MGSVADTVILFGHDCSPPCAIVRIALDIKGIHYEFVEEDLTNKSADLLKYNPVHKKVPVLVHNGDPIAESLIIIEYIDEVWKKHGNPILPLNDYEKSQARFWARFFVDTCAPAIFKAITSHGKAEEVAEVQKQLQFLENELKRKGTKFFGGDDIINLVDLALSFIAYWQEAAEEAVGMKAVVTKEQFPKLTEWSQNYVKLQLVKDVLPPREKLVDFFKAVLAANFNNN